LQGLLFPTAENTCHVFVGIKRPSKEVDRIPFGETFDYCVPKADMSLALGRLTMQSADRHLLQTRSVAQAPQAEKIYVVKPPAGRYHESLWEIAQNHRGNGLRYREIFEMNKNDRQAELVQLSDRTGDARQQLEFLNRARGVRAFAAWHQLVDDPIPVEKHGPIHARSRLERCAPRGGEAGRGRFLRAVFRDRQPELER